MDYVSDNIARKEVSTDMTANRDTVWRSQINWDKGRKIMMTCHRYYLGPRPCFNTGITKIHQKLT